MDALPDCRRRMLTLLAPARASQTLNHNFGMGATQRAWAKSPHHARRAVHRAHTRSAKSSATAENDRVAGTANDVPDQNIRPGNRSSAIGPTDHETESKPREANGAPQRHRRIRAMVPVVLRRPRRSTRPSVQPRQLCVRPLPVGLAINLRSDAAFRAFGPDVPDDEEFGFE